MLILQAGKQLPITRVLIISVDSVCKRSAFLFILWNFGEFPLLSVQFVQLIGQFHVLFFVLFCVLLVELALFGDLAFVPEVAEIGGI